MTAATAPGAARGRAREGASKRKDLRYALVDDVTAPLNQVRTDKGKLRLLSQASSDDQFSCSVILKKLRIYLRGAINSSFIPFHSCTHRQHML